MLSSTGELFDVARKRLDHSGHFKVSLLKSGSFSLGSLMYGSFSIMGLLILVVG